MRKTAIILTMHIGNSESKKKMYLLNILDWLNYTPFDIYTVESSGQSFYINHPRLFEFNFKQQYTILPSVTISEKNSILHIFENFPKLFTYDIIFKITGKYFSHDFVDEYKKNQESNMYIQYSHIVNPLRYIILFIFILFIILYIIYKKKYMVFVFLSCIIILFISYFISYENTELIGATPILLYDFFSSIKNECCEISLYNFIMNRNLRYHRFNSLSISKKYPRNDGSILNKL